MSENTQDSGLTAYSTKYTRDAQRTRDGLILKYSEVIYNIEAELTDRLDLRSERISPAPINDAFVYCHPDPRIEVTFQVDRSERVIYFTHISVPEFKLPLIFISYAREDSEWLSKLKLYLKTLEQQGLIDFWDDTRLEEGDPWRQDIDTALAAAKAGLLLVSQEFLTSKFIWKVELPKLLGWGKEGGNKKVFWVHVTPAAVDLYPQIKRFQALLDDPALSELDEAAQRRVFVRITKELADSVINGKRE